MERKVKQRKKEKDKKTNKDLASESFLKVVKDIIKVTAYQERYGLGDVVLLLEGAPSAIPDVSISR